MNKLPKNVNWLEAVIFVAGDVVTRLAKICSILPPYRWTNQGKKRRAPPMLIQTILLIRGTKLERVELNIMNAGKNRMKKISIL